MSAQVQELMCPNCGTWGELNEYTGFCIKCSTGQCNSCGATFQPDRNRYICPYCRREAWYHKYADQIESLLLLGFTLDKARELISRDNAARCTSCGGVIEKGRRSETLFCTKTEKCRKAKRRYRTLKKRYVGYSDILPYTHVLLEVHLATESIREERTAA
jgi:hypothetical protein